MAILAAFVAAPIERVMSVMKGLRSPDATTTSEASFGNKARRISTCFCAASTIAHDKPVMLPPGAA